MVEQSGESFLLPFPCCLPHTVQSLGHALPALCRTHVRLNDVLLSLRPSSPASAEACASLFDWFTGTTAQSDFSGTCMSAVWFMAFADRSCSFEQDVREISRFSCMLFLSVRGFSDYAGPNSHSRNSVATVLPSSISEGSRHPDPSAFRSSIARPTGTSGLRFTRHLTVPPARLEARMESLFSFPVGLFHPLQHAGLSRRTPSGRQTSQNLFLRVEIQGWLSIRGRQSCVRPCG